MKSKVGRRLFGRRFLVGALVVTLGGLTAQGAVAASATVAPPFDQSTKFNNCAPSGPTIAAATGTCSTTTTVDAQTGAFDVAAAVTSTGNGAIPLTAYNGVSAQVDLSVSQAITAAATKITYSISYHIDSATTSPGHSASPVADQASGSRAWFSASATMSSCECGQTQFVNLVDSSGSAAPTQVSNSDGTITLTVANANGGSITPGTMSISIGANSAVIAEPLTSGTVGSSALGSITNITATTT